MGVFISLVLIPASYLSIRAKVNDYLGSSMGVDRRYMKTYGFRDLGLGHGHKV